MLDSLRFTTDVRRVLGLRGFGRREVGGTASLTMSVAEGSGPRKVREREKVGR